MTSEVIIYLGTYYYTRVLDAMEVVIIIKL